MPVACPTTAGVVLTTHLSTRMDKNLLTKLLRDSLNIFNSTAKAHFNCKSTSLDFTHTLFDKVRDLVIRHWITISCSNQLNACWTLVTCTTKYFQAFLVNSNSTLHKWHTNKIQLIILLYIINSNSSQPTATLTIFNKKPSCEIQREPNVCKVDNMTQTTPLLS